MKDDAVPLATANAPGLLVCTDLVKAYDAEGNGFQLGPVTLTVRAGETLGVLGKNGAGKTTLFQLLTGNLDATGGTVQLSGHRLTPDAPQLKRRVGYLPQDPLLPRWSTGRELLTYAASLYGLTDAGTRIPAAEAYWDCASFNHKPLAALSYGMQKRVALALASLSEPECLILDEPFSGLDLVHIKALEDLIKRRKRLGQATILSTHVMAFCATLCDDAVMIKGGKMTALGGWQGRSRMEREQLIEDAFFGPGA